jgi:hypothetical protein
VDSLTVFEIWEQQSPADLHRPVRRSLGEGGCPHARSSEKPPRAKKRRLLRRKKQSLALRISKIRRHWLVKSIFRMKLTDAIALRLRR